MPLVPSTSVGGAFSGAKVFLTTNLAIATNTAITWDTVSYDTDGYFSGGSPTLFTVPAGLGGRFLLGFSTDIAGAPSGSFGFNLNQSGQPDTTIGVTGTVGSGQNANPLVTICGQNRGGSIAAGVTFLVKAFWSASPQTLSGGEDTCFWIQRLSA